MTEFFTVIVSSEDSIPDVKEMLETTGKVERSQIRVATDKERLRPLPKVQVGNRTYAGWGGVKYFISTLGHLP